MAVAPNGDVYVAYDAGTGQPRTKIASFSDRDGTLTQTGSFVIHELMSANRLRVDGAGNVYASGLCAHELTSGTQWPLPRGVQPNPSPGLCRNPQAGGTGIDSQELLVVADPSGQLTYGTFVGANILNADVSAMEIDARGNTYLAGQTDAGLVDVTSNAYQPQPGNVGCTVNCWPGDAFLVVIDPSQSGAQSLSHCSTLRISAAPTASATSPWRSTLLVAFIWRAILTRANRSRAVA
jgi:hypothetical protein